jgi:adenosylcobinamide-GDP ribazoletransferase
MAKIRLDAQQKPVKKAKSDNKWGFLGLISFSTVLPIEIHSSIPEMARYTWLWPLIGAFIGILVGGFAFLVANLINLPSLLSATLIYSFAILLTGLHHLDGLVDFGDGLMAHGDPERRIEIMRDQKVGTGGIASLLIVSLISVVSISYLPLTYLPLMILISEIAAKIGIITCSTFSIPYENGTGAYFIENMSPILLVISLIISVIIGFFTINLVGVMGILGGLITGLFMALLARQKFKWTTGDILGASNEISRMISLLLMVALALWVM